MKTEFTELLQQRIDNEIKQKRITIVTATLFSVFALIIIGLGIYSYNQKRVIVSKNEELSHLNLTLRQKTIKLDSMGEALKRANSRLTQDTATLSRTADNYEQLNSYMQKAIKNIASANISEVKQMPPPRFPMPGNDNNGNIHLPSASGNPHMENAITTNKTNRAIDEILKKSNPQGYTIYIQYMQAFASQSSSLRAAFETDEYKVPEEQNMKKMSFPSSVRYFYEVDEDKATEIANKAQEIIHKKFRVQFIRLKAPKKQLEIWVGK